MVFLFRYLSSVALLLTVKAENPAQPVKRSQCASTLSTAASVANVAYSQYWDFSFYPPGYEFTSTRWINANALEDIHNLMLAAGTDQYSSTGDDSTIGQYAELGLSWSLFIGGAYDDAQWIILALWKIGDYKTARGQDASKYINAAESIYQIIAGEWDTSNCGGGVWWSSDHNYKNAITNHLFLLTSASGYLRTNDPTYLANANKVWNWLESSGMRNSQGLWNDGLDLNTCANNGETTWTYNQAVIASGLGALYAATGDSTLLDQAEITLDATMNSLTSSDILKESCDNAAPGGASCDSDEYIFKGIWMKHVQYYLDTANDDSRTAKYSPFLGSQESAIIHYATGSDYAVGNVWYAPNQGGSVVSAESQISGLAAHVSAAKYGPC